MIINSRPPNFELIHEHFPKADQPGVIFAFDGCIYNPSGNVIPQALIDHENVHLRRQRELRAVDAANVWWRLYCTDSEFRYREELLAHVAEFKALRGSDRNARAMLLTHTAIRLVAPLYNYLPPRTLQQALKDLRQEIGK